MCKLIQYGCSTAAGVRVKGGYMPASYTFVGYGEVGTGDVKNEERSQVMGVL